MKASEFYIQELDLSLEPNIEDVDIGGIEIEFEIVEGPQYLEDLRLLRSIFEISLDLKQYGSPVGNSDSNTDPEQDDVGEVTTEVVATIEGEQNEFTEYISTWEEEGYRALPWDFRFHVESGIISEVLSPIAGLVDNSFRGILPMIALSSPPETDQSQIGDMEEELEEELSERVMETVEDVLEDTEYSVDDIALGEAERNDEESAEDQD